MVSTKPKDAKDIIFIGKHGKCIRVLYLLYIGQILKSCFSLCP